MILAPEEEFQGQPVQFLYQNSPPALSVHLQVAGVPSGCLIALKVGELIPLHPSTKDGNERDSGEPFLPIPVVWAASVSALDSKEELSNST